MSPKTVLPRRVKCIERYSRYSRCTANKKNDFLSFMSFMCPAAAVVLPKVHALSSIEAKRISTRAGQQVAVTSKDRSLSLAPRALDAIRNSAAEHRDENADLHKAMTSSLNPTEWT